MRKHENNRGVVVENLLQWILDLHVIYPGALVTVICLIIALLFSSESGSLACMYTSLTLQLIVFMPYALVCYFDMPRYSYSRKFFRMLPTVCSICIMVLVHFLLIDILKQW